MKPMLPIEACVYVRTYVYKKAYLNMLANILKIIVLGSTNCQQYCSGSITA